jgi:hypothetical protein
VTETSRPQGLLGAEGGVEPSTAASGMDGFWHRSHRHLLGTVRPTLIDRVASRSPHWIRRLGMIRTVDAVVVPTSRSMTHKRRGIDMAIDLAAESGAPLIVMCSRDAASAASLADLRARISRRRRLDAVTIVLADDTTSLTDFGVDRLEVSLLFRRGGNSRQEPWRKVPRNDVGRKRNLALLVARAMGWRRILFLDDDVYPRPGLTLDLATLSAAARATSAGPAAVVGWTLREFDDNSVLCRIRSRLHRDQEQFIGGGALLVRVDEKTPFFPAIYNEDWLFLLALLLGERRSLGEGGDVHQEEYEAYTPNRARSEELGDILGEGLLSLLAAGDMERAADPAYWCAAMRERVRLRNELAADVPALTEPDAAAMSLALDTIEAVHATLRREETVWAQRLAEYWPQWTEDLSTWTSRMRAARTCDPFDLLTGEDFDPARSTVLGRERELEGFLRRYRRPRRQSLAGSPPGGPGVVSWTAGRTHSY